MTDVSTTSSISVHTSRAYKNWQHAMAWAYMVIVAFDFILFPIGWPILLAHYKQPIVAWQPLTLQGGGLFHLAMGAILGVTSWRSYQNTTTAS